MRLPNVWGQGALFAFSGLDGECGVYSCLNAALLGDNLGIRIHAQELFDLYVLLAGIKDVRYDVVASDVIVARLKDAQGIESPFMLTFSNQQTIVGLCGQGRAQLRSQRALNEARTEHGSVFQSGTSSFHFWRKVTNGLTLFSFSLGSFAPVTKEEIESLCQKRIDFLKRFEPLCPKDEALAVTFLKCISVMKSQIHTADGAFRQRWSTPNRLPHRWLWLWDSVFHSFGNILLDETLPRDCLMSVFDVQREDGFIPHLARPGFTSDITQPPVMAWGVLKYVEKTGDVDFARQIAPKLQKYLEWNIANRTDPESGLFFWHVNTDSENCRADESGMDNSPRFDNVSVMECIDFCCFMMNEAKAMAKINAMLDVREGRDWADYAQTLKRLINENLWDEEDGLYYDRIPASKAFHEVRAFTSFLPLFCGAATEERAQKLLCALHSEDFATALPLPSVSRLDPSFDGDMWRGAVWVNYNYMIALGLKRYGYTSDANEIILKTVREVSRFYLTDGVIYEMYDPDGRISPRFIRRKGAPIEPYDPRVRYQVIRDYGWSSTLFAAMIHENRELFG